LNLQARDATDLNENFDEKSESTDQVIPYRDRYKIKNEATTTYYLRYYRNLQPPLFVEKWKA